MSSKKAAVAKPPPPKKYANAREARADGKVWVTVKINGGVVSHPKLGHSVGTLAMNGPMDVEQSFVLWMAACGHTVAGIERERAKVFDKPDKPKPKKRG